MTKSKENEKEITHTLFILNELSYTMKNISQSSGRQRQHWSAKQISNIKYTDYTAANNNKEPNESKNTGQGHQTKNIGDTTKINYRMQKKNKHTDFGRMFYCLTFF